jgi:hypothetical protein
METTKIPRPPNPRMKTGKAKHSGFHNGQDDCKESVQLAKTLHIQELRDLMNRNKK